MRTLLPIAVAAATGLAQGQLSVTSHTLGGDYSASAFAGSASGSFNVSEPGGYLEVIPEATLVDQTGLFSANFFGVLQSETTGAGFRTAGFVDADQPLVPFYEQSHDLFATVRFELSSETPIRISGTLVHDPATSDDAIVLLNGTSFEIRDVDTSDLPLSVSVSPIGDVRSLAIDTVVVLPAGSYSADLTSFSRMGPPLSPGLLDVKVSWDLSVEIVPAPATLAIAPMALLASRRRR